MFSNAFLLRRPARTDRGRTRCDGLDRKGNAFLLLEQTGGANQCRQQRDEQRHELRVERTAGLVLQQPNRAFTRERLVVRTLGRHRVVVIDDREDARANRNLVGHEPLRVALAVPSFVVTQDQRRHRIRERHGGDDLGADCG